MDGSPVTITTGVSLALVITVVFFLGKWFQKLEIISKDVNNLRKNMHHNNNILTAWALKNDVPIKGFKEDDETID